MKGMNSSSFIGQRVKVTIDRPLNSKHPRYALIYELNYGYVPGAVAPDGEFLDAYILGEPEPVARFEGVCIAVIHRLDDEDDKLIVVPPGQELQYDDERIRQLVQFQERFFTSIIIRGIQQSAELPQVLEGDPAL